MENEKRNDHILWSFQEFQLPVRIDIFILYSIMLFPCVITL